MCYKRTWMLHAATVVWDFAFNGEPQASKYTRCRPPNQNDTSMALSSKKKKIRWKFVVRQEHSTPRQQCKRIWHGFEFPPSENSTKTRRNFANIQMKFDAAKYFPYLLLLQKFRISKRSNEILKKPLLIRNVLLGFQFSSFHCLQIQGLFA